MKNTCQNCNSTHENNVCPNCEHLNAAKQNSSGNKNTITLLATLFGIKYLIYTVWTINKPIVYMRQILLQNNFSLSAMIIAYIELCIVLALIRSGLVAIVSYPVSIGVDAVESEILVSLFFVISNLFALMLACLFPKKWFKPATRKITLTISIQLMMYMLIYMNFAESIISVLSMPILYLFGLNVITGSWILMLNLMFLGILLISSIAFIMDTYRSVLNLQQLAMAILLLLPMMVCILSWMLLEKIRFMLPAWFQIW